MAQIAGGKVGSLKNLKKTLKQGGDRLLTWIPKEDGIVVRFLTEPEEWFGFYEHYDESLRRSYPCVDGNCPGCATDARRSFRYVANALDIENDKVIALLLPKDLANRLTARYQKYDTLMDRDYELYRTGEGLDTTYDSTPESPRKRAVSKYKLMDLGDVLQKVWDSVWAGDEDDDDDDEEEAPRKRQSRNRSKSRSRSSGSKSKASSTKKRRKADEDEDDEDEFDEDEDELEEDDDLDDDEDFDDEDDDDLDDDEDDDDYDDEDDDDFDDEDDDFDDDEDGEWTEDELEEMSMAMLREIARDYGIVPTKKKKAQLIEAILEADED